MRAVPGATTKGEGMSRRECPDTSQTQRAGMHAREAYVSHADAPPIRRGARSGYPGRTEYDAADQRLRRALAQLAREADPGARLVGAQLAEQATALLTELAAHAEAASPTLRRRAAREARLLATAERLRAAGGSTTTAHTPAVTVAAEQPKEA